MLVRLCVRVSHVSTCELVSSQGHLVIPQAYQGQRTHKYQRQMPHTHSKNNCVSSGCRCHSSLSLSLSVCHAVFVCMEFLTSLSGLRPPICRYASLLIVRPRVRRRSSLPAPPSPPPSLPLLACSLCFWAAHC